MDSALLDPETLTPRLTVPHAEIIDQHRFLRIEDDRIKPMRLHDLRSEQVVDVPRPPHYGWTDPRVSQVSPDGRWLGFTFADPGRSPQVMDVWLLDLSGPQWTRAPAMPTRAALKATDIAFAPNGRLVMLGRFGDDDNPRELLATWRPGEPQWALLPLRRPEPPPGQPVDTRFLVL